MEKRFSPRKFSEYSLDSLSTGPAKSTAASTAPGTGRPVVLWAGVSLYFFVWWPGAPLPGLGAASQTTVVWPKRALLFLAQESQMHPQAWFLPLICHLCYWHAPYTILGTDRGNVGAHGKAPTDVAPPPASTLYLVQTAGHMLPS